MRKENDIESVNYIKSIIKDFIDVVDEDYFIRSTYNLKFNNRKLAYVYVIYNEDTNLYKIGCTKDIISRIKKIKSDFRNMIGIEANLSLKYIIPCSNGQEFKIETTLHKTFKDVRKFGEWFDLESDEYYVDILGAMDTMDGIQICSRDELFKKELEYNIDNLNEYDISRLNILPENIKQYFYHKYKQNRNRTSYKDNGYIIDSINKIYDNYESNYDYLGYFEKETNCINAFKEYYNTLSLDDRKIFS